MASKKTKEDYLLIMLKQDLQMMTTAFDDYLVNLLAVAESFIAQEGIKLEDDIEDNGLLVMYAAYLYRNRTNPAGAMPRMLRLALNNRKFGKKEAAHNGPI